MKTESIRSILFLISILLIADCLFGNDLGVTLRYGVVRSNQSWNYYNGDFNGSDLGENYIYRDGHDIGIGLQKYISPTVSLQIDALYAEKGSRLQVSGLNYHNGILIDTTIIVSRFVDYIEVPLLVQYHPKSLHEIVYVEVGIRADFIFGFNFEYGSAFDESDFSSINWGATFGVGASFKTGHLRSISIGVRYNPDITSIYDNGLLRIKNSTFAANLGYTINI